MEIRCERFELDQAMLHCLVRDTGIGIPVEKQRSIFEAFSQADSSTTREFGGTGLGLAICKRLVQMIGGEIWVVSEAGQGSEFHFTMRVGVAEGPLSDEETHQGRSLAALANVCQGEKTILLAEDNPANRLVARYTLEGAGFQVREVENGREAVEAVRQTSFDVVLMDCRMPVMDGYEAARQVRRLDGAAGRVPIIALTASAFKEDREQARQAGMDDFVAKPFDDADLVTKCLLWSNGRSHEEPGSSALPADLQATGSVDGDQERLRSYSPEFLRSMMVIFLETAPPVFKKLRSAVEVKDWEGVRSGAHWLRGGASRIVGPDLQGELEALEAACQAKAPEVSEAQVKALEGAFEKACQTAENWLAEDRAYAS